MRIIGVEMGSLMLDNVHEYSITFAFQAAKELLYTWHQLILPHQVLGH